MTPAELLAKFIDPNHPNAGIRAPIRQNGFLFGTNGEIMVRIPDDLAVEAVSHLNPDLRVPNCEMLFAQAFKGSGFAHLNFPLPNPPDCTTCHGKGKVAKCPDCDGEGSFDHGTHNYECKECDGNGVSKKGNRELACPDCAGTGKNQRGRIAFGPSGFQHRYLALLQSLGDAELAVFSEHGTASFRFAGGEGILMPVRK